MSSPSRDRLLEAVVRELASEGLLGRSLRDVAAAVGSSHRMLLHHFGSREGLLTEVVRTVEESQRRALAELGGDDAGELMIAMWSRLSQPEYWPHERLFFECYVRAIRREEPFSALLPQLVDSWIDPVASLEEARGVPRAEARARARLGLALCRGLLLDLVATEDRGAVDEAFDAFVAMARNDRRSREETP
jgi:AcrR family transcriptional regulator